MAVKRLDVHDDGWIEGVGEAFVFGEMAARLVVVHASMDEWERDFLARLDTIAPEHGNTVDKLGTTCA